ncbi:MAG: carboxypeptidase-like regulatory domain-containing protein [Parachlamydiales bacterium]|jgi:hypothetical protein
MVNYLQKGCLYPFIKYGLIGIAILQFSLAYAAECTLITPPSLEVTPGEAAVIIINISNPGKKDVLIPFDLQLPPECESLVECDKLIPLSPDSSHMLLVPISVAKGSLPGLHEVVFSIDSKPYSVILDVQGQRELSFEVEKTPSLVAEGQRFPITLSTHNAGNITVPIRIKTIIDNDAWAVLDCEEYDLVPGENTIFYGQVGVLPTTCRAKSRVLQIIVLDACTDEELYSYCSVVDVLPCGMDSIPDPWVNVSGFFRMFATGQEGELVVGTELYGRGFIDEDQLREIDYEFLIPSEAHTTLYNQYQRLFVGIIDPQFEFVLGDTNYYLTPLTERWGYGRGIGIDFTFDRLSYGSFYRQNRQNHNCQFEEGAAYLQYAYSPFGNISLNYIRRSQVDTPQGNIVSIRCEEAPAPGRFFGLEFAYDTSTKKHQGDRKGFDIDFKNTFGRDSSCYFTRTYAGKGFYGYYNDADYYSAGVDLGLSAVTRLLVTTNRVCQNLNHCDTTAPRWRDYTAKLSYWYDACSQITLVGNLLTGRDAYDPCNFDFSQAWGGIQYSFNTGRYALFCISEVGGQKNHVTDTFCKPLQRYNFDFNMTVDPVRSFTLHYECGNTNPYDARQWRYAAGGAFLWRYQYLSYAEIYARAINDRFYGDKLNGKCYDGRYVHAMGRVSHTLSNLHNIGVRLDCFFSRHQDSRDEYKFIASYTIPTKTPVKWRTDFGSIEGTVYDQMTNEPVSNAVVSLGDDARLTDECGNFRFSNLCPGIHTLSTSMLPARMLQTNPCDIPVNVMGGRTVCNDITTTYAGQVEGDIKMYNYEENLNLNPSTQRHSPGVWLSLVEAKGLSNTRIILSRNGTGEILSTTTNCLGHFKFDNLHPGLWTMKIMSNEVPLDHYMENDTLEIVVQRMVSEKIEIKVLPRPKEILPMVL